MVHIKILNNTAAFVYSFIIKKTRLIFLKLLDSWNKKVYILNMKQIAYNLKAHNHNKKRRY